MRWPTRSSRPGWREVGPVISATCRRRSMRGHSRGGRCRRSEHDLLPLRYVEGAMIADLALGRCACEKEPLDIFGRNISVSKLGIAAETEASVEGRVAKDDAAIRLQFAQSLK